MVHLHNSNGIISIVYFGLYFKNRTELQNLNMDVGNMVLHTTKHTEIQSVFESVQTCMWNKAAQNTSYWKDYYGQKLTE